MDEVWDCQLVANARINKKISVSPIFKWTDDEIWKFIKTQNLTVNSLYCEGFRRVGCVGCPMAGKNRVKEFNRFPKFKEMYIRAFDNMLAKRLEVGLKNEWVCGEEVYEWWIENKQVKGQIKLY